jgi:hypothetical protein
MMEEDPLSGLPYNTIEVDGHKQQSVLAFNKAISNKAVAMFLFSVIGLSLLSLSLLATIANAQTSSSNSRSGTNSASNKNGAKEMGICVVGQGGPCNADSNWDGTHDVTGKCVLLNGCSNNYNGNSNSINNKNMNNNVNVK